MKISIDLENSTEETLNKAMKLIQETLKEKYEFNQLKLKDYLSYFDKEEITYDELKEKIKDKEKLDLILIHLKKLGEIYEKRKNVFARI